MSAIFLIALLIFPICWPIIAKMIFHSTINWKEMLCNIIVVVIFVLLIYSVSTAGKTKDIEIWNGEVKNKVSEKVSCSHSYSCNCHQVSCGKDCTTTQCDTCYEHDYDIDWRILTNVGNFEIDRIDEQGLKEPPRYSKIVIGDPVASKHEYENYIKAVPDSLFNKSIDKLTAQEKQCVPLYPSNVYDYQYIDRILTVCGSKIPNEKEWNNELAKILKGLGPKKQANIILIFNGKYNPTFKYALEVSWLGGKKNDIIVIFYMSKYPTIDKIEVVSWTNKEIFKKKLSNDLMEIGNVSQISPIMSCIEMNTYKYFERRHMKDFEYLKDEILPPTWLLVLLFILSVAFSVGLTIFFHREEVF